MSKASKKAVVMDDDVEDLDDVLEQFGAPQPKASPKPPPAAPAAPAKPASSLPTTSRPTSKPNGPSNDAVAKPNLDFDLSDDFAAELAKGMASLMREIAADASPNATSGATGGAGGLGTSEEEMEFRRAWEKMLVEGMNGAMGGLDGLGEAEKDAFVGKPGAGTSASTKGKEKQKEKKGEEKKAAPEPDDFQTKIKMAMEKLKESESNLQASAASEEGEGLESLLKSLGEGGAGGESEEELQGLLESMMTQLLSKEILYEPLKELHEKFPGYMRDNAEKLKLDDKKRYEAQQAIVGKILTIFEDPRYSDDDPEQGIKVVGLMNEMQAHGSPPAEIMGPLPPGLDMGSDGLPKLPDIGSGECTIA